MRDEAFPLSENLMRPYPKKHVTGNYKNRIFNDRLSQARQSVEGAFGILPSCFREFRKPFKSKVDSVRDCAKAAYVLHNYWRSSVAIREHINDIDHLAQTQLLSKSTQYFNNWGAVLWQHQSIVFGEYEIYNIYRGHFLI